MPPAVHGIHHITAIGGSPQSNLDFYTRTLGLRLVKRTVNFDDPLTYHFYFGNETGDPGTILTFFPWGGDSLRGRIGTGQVSVSGFSIPADSIDYWVERLATHEVPFDGPDERFGQPVITLRDPDGVALELVGVSGDARASRANGEIPPDRAIRGFHHASLSLVGFEKTAGILTDVLGFRRAAGSGNRFRFVCGGGEPGAIVDLLCEPDRARGSMGVGVVHHIAFRVATDAGQLALREILAAQGRDVTPVMDRQYFHSIYFREPGGVLFEIATDAPGFVIDEPAAELGMHLKLPPWLESQRTRIEGHIAPIKLARSNNPGAR